MMAFGFIDIGIPASSGLYVGNSPNDYDDIIVSSLLGCTEELSFGLGRQKQLTQGPIRAHIK